MDKQQATELHIKNIDLQFKEHAQEDFEAGWEAHETQSPTDAIAHAMDFANFLFDNGVRKLQAKNSWIVDHHNYGPLEKYYKLFNPSGAASKNKDNDA